MKTAPRPSSPVHSGPVAVELSIVMPCLNEAETLPTCIAKAREAIEKGGYSAELIVADNGTSHGSQLIARELGPRAVDVQRKGYSHAPFAGIKPAPCHSSLT